jgi:ATP-dependent DNA helicase RecQ
VASEHGVPPYIVFTDKTLREMTVHLPETASALKEINGVGEVKCQHYGKYFLKEIRIHIENITKPGG